MGGVVTNLRVLQSPVTGVQRYTQELLQRLPGSVETVQPPIAAQGLSGHLWEQAVLPLTLGRRLLFSPANTGPLAVERQVVAIHDVAALDHPEWLNPTFAAWYRFLTPRLANRVRRVIVVSEFSKRRLCEAAGVDPGKVRVVPHGVDPRFHPTNGRDSARVREALELPAAPYLLTVGSLEPRKNLARLLAAWARVQASLPAQPWLVIVGAKGSARVFKQLDLDPLPPRVILTGHLSDELLPSVYAQAHAFVYVSLYEGFGLPPLEAMASGVPVIAADSTSLPEVVGDAALMVDPRDVASIAGAIERVCADEELRRLLVAKGLARAATFSWTTAATTTWEILQEAMTE
jgi:glycosyltransferase involved in cell wall biosynthesis